MLMVNKTKRRPAGSLAISGEVEPVTTEQDIDRTFVGALNWYGIRWETSDYQKAASAYAAHLGITDADKAIKKAKPTEYRYFAVAGRLVANGHFVNDKFRDLALEQLDKIKTKYAAAPRHKKTNQPSIAERMLHRAKEYGAEIDGEIDDFLLNDCVSKFDASKYLLEKDIPGKMAVLIAGFYTEMAAELEAAITAEDEQLVEAYSFLGGECTFRFYEFVHGIINACEKHAKLMKSQRKPRKRKVQTADKIVAKMRHLNRDNELGLDSVDARKILGASELWAYDVEKRKLMVYRAMDQSGLGVKGTSITNYALGSSSQKTVRKPLDFFKSLNDTKKRNMKKVWSSINGKELNIKPRINANTILVAVN